MLDLIIEIVSQDLQAFDHLCLCKVQAQCLHKWFFIETNQSSWSWCLWSSAWAVDYITLGYPSCSWMHINTDFWSSDVLCCLCCCNLATYSCCYSLSMNALKFLTMLPLLLGLGHLPKPFDTWIPQFPILWQTGHLKSLHLISCWQQ
jgi:hypothetical protein